jgi:L-fuconolactonase
MSDRPATDPQRAERADAHIHLFEKSFQGSFTARDGVAIDEARLYASLMKSHRVARALVVCYEGQDWAEGNNAYVARLSEKLDWIRPVAYFEPADLHEQRLEAYLRQQFVGISLYIFGEKSVKALEAVPAGVWAWLEKHKWLISVNARGVELSAWLPILEKHPALRLMISHLGLPPKVDAPPAIEHARAALADVLTLARYPHTHIKLSGFYAITDPGHDYPHRAAWPYVQALIDAFTPRRLCWGSDFSPSLDNLTFPQTFGLFQETPFLSDQDRANIQGRNLLQLIEEVAGIIQKSE